MTVAKDLAARLRAFVAIDGGDLADIAAAADLIEQQAAEIALLEFQRDGANEAANRWREQFIQARADAERYRWLRGGPDVPPESNRWARWEVRHWRGRWWNTMFAEALDAAIDAAMKGTT